MKTYLIYIKSHCEAPDYEDEVQAKNKREATEKFLERMNNYDDVWSTVDIREHIMEIKV